jgi:phenylacetate-CoA ligase
VISSFQPGTSGSFRIIADFEGHATNDPLRMQVEVGADIGPSETIAIKDQIARRIREMLVFQPNIEMVRSGTLPKPGSAKVSLIERPG